MPSAIENAARRVLSSSLERARTYRVYKSHIKDAKNTNELEGDPVFRQLRSDYLTASDNHKSAEIAYDAVKRNPPV